MYNNIISDAHAVAVNIMIYLLVLVVYFCGDKLLRIRCEFSLNVT